MTNSEMQNTISGCREKLKIDFYNSNKWRKNIKEGEKFAIWYSQDGIASTPEFCGTEKEVARRWMTNYNKPVTGFMIALENDRDTLFEALSFSELQPFCP